MIKTKQNLFVSHPGRSEKENSKFNTIMLLAALPVVIFAILAASEGSSLMSAAAVALVTLYCFVAKPEQSICVIAAVSMLQNSLYLGGDNSMYIFVLAFLVRTLLAQKKRVFKDIYSFVGLIVLLFIEILTDYLSIAGFGATLVASVYVVFLIYTLSVCDLFEFDPFAFILIYLTGFLTACICVANSYGGMLLYISDVLTSSSILRFGTDAEMFIGGAMGVPIYAAILISVSVLYFINGKKEKRYQKLIAFFAILISFIFGMLTVSRSFLLAIAVFLIVFLYSFKSKKKWPIVISAIVLILIFALIFNDVAEKVIYNFIYRIDNDETGGSGRIIIWQACLEYLFSNPVTTFFGAGAASYIGFSSGEKFDVSAGAHNLILDIFMSWGFVGAFIVIASVVAMLVTVRRKYGKLAFLSFAPFLAYMAYGMTAFRTNSLPTWALLIITLLTISWFNKERANNDT